MQSILNPGLLLTGGLMAVVGALLGLLGGGGSILAVPVLIMVGGLEPRQAIAISLAVVGAASLLASVQHGKNGHVDPRLALWMGGTGLAGAYLGARLSAHVSAQFLSMAFALVMLVAAAAMLRPNGPASTVTAADRHPRRLPVIVSGLLLGVLTGFLGVGGGFLIVPTLVLLARVPMKTAVGTSLPIIAANAAAGFAAHWPQVAGAPGLTVALAATALAGAQVGSQTAARLPAAHLKRGFALLVLAIGLVLLGHSILSQS